MFCFLEAEDRGSVWEAEHFRESENQLRAIETCHLLHFSINIKQGGIDEFGDEGLTAFFLR